MTLDVAKDTVKWLLENAKIADCKPDGTPILRIEIKTDLCILSFLTLTFMWCFVLVKMIKSTIELNTFEATVAIATPLTPKSRPATKKKFKPTLSTPETARILSGVLVSPTALNIADSKLNNKIKLFSN